MLDYFRYKAMHMSITTCESKFPSNVVLPYLKNLKQRTRRGTVLIGSRRKEDILKSGYLKSYQNLYCDHSRRLQNAFD